MSDTSQGPDWWQASDGKWYPPQQDTPGPAGAPQPAMAAPGSPGAGGTGVPSLDAGALVSYGWAAFKRYPGQLIAAILIPGIGGMIFNYPAQLALIDGSWFVYAVLLVLGWGVQMALTKGLIAVTLDITYGREPDLSKMFSGENLGQFILTAIIFGAIVGIGFVFFIIPGIILAIIYGMSLFGVVEKGLGPAEALKYSAEITKKHRGKIFVIGIVFFLVSMLGVLACLIGLLVAAPVVSVGWAATYRILEGESPVPVPA